MFKKLGRCSALEEIKSKIMVEGVHYLVVPGCGKKPMITKEGAELLCMAFQTGGAPASGSVDEHLDNIDGNTTKLTRTEA